MSNGEGPSATAAIGHFLVWLYQKQKEGNKVCKFIWWLLWLVLLVAVVGGIGSIAEWW